MPLVEGCEGDGRLDEDGCDADDLQNGLYLTKPACRNNQSLLAAYHESDGGHRKLAEHYDSCRPDKYGADIAVSVNNGEHCAEHHELIRKGVHKLAEIGDKVILSCDLTVKHIGKACENEDDCRNKAPYHFVILEVGDGCHHNYHKYS